jgi:hypothetical protein
MDHVTAAQQHFGGFPAVTTTEVHHDTPLDSTASNGIGRISSAETLNGQEQANGEDSFEVH